MEKIRIGDICTYRFPSKLNYSPDGSKAVMVIAQASEDKKGYDRDLYLLEGDVLKRLTYSKDTGNYTFENNDSLLFVGARTDKEKERSKRKVSPSYTGSLSTEAKHIPYMRYLFLYILLK